MRDPNVTSFATPLAFNAPDGVVPLERSPQNFARKLKDGEGTKWRRDIAESFNPLSRAHDRYRRQTDLRQQRPERNGVTFG